MNLLNSKISNGVLNGFVIQNPYLLYLEDDNYVDEVERTEDFIYNINEDNYSALCLDSYKGGIGVIEY